MKNQLSIGYNLKPIQICGGIASGKTTLAALLSRLNLVFVNENFQSNPFWQAFYADPVGTAFETEITFLLQHYHQIKTAAKQAQAFACDFSLLLDLAYAHVTLNDAQRKVFRAVYRQIQSELPKPDLVIHLSCDPEIELERIKRRGREAEQSITVDYLAALNAALIGVLETEAKSEDILRIDSGLIDFANSESDQGKVLAMVRGRLGLAM